MMKKLLVLLCVLACVFALSAEGAAESMKAEKVEIKVLILPKFEVGELSGDFPGEAQYYYEGYLKGGDEYDVKGGVDGSKLYVKDGVALYLTGMGKVNAALSLQAIMLDDRFDFSNAYVISTGCAGSAYGSTVMGDVFIITAAIDYDLGHHADPREMMKEGDATWFHDASYDGSSYKLLDKGITDKAYELAKGVELKTTPKTLNAMGKAFGGEEWALRNPMVLKGTTVSGDNYWKGYYNDANARLQCETYGAPDPFALTEMEDVAIAVALDRLGCLDRYLIIRDSVNMDVFMNGASPDSLWDPNFVDSIASSESVESADIFATAMENNYKVGSVIIDAIMDGTF